MIRALLDTNVLIDYMVPDRPGSDCAGRIIESLATGKFEALVSAGSLKDSYYIVRKHFPDALVREYLSLFMELLEVLPVDRVVCASALKNDEPDFEDGIVRAIAETAGADLIITRDTAAFVNSRTRSISPQRFADLFLD